MGEAPAKASAKASGKDGGGKDEAPEELGPPDFRVGDEVEARSMEEGYEGARYLARLVEADEINRRGTIEFYAFHDSEAPDQRLRDWTEYFLIRPPPPKTVQFGLKTSWLRKMYVGAAVEVWHEDGWMDADLMSVLSADASDHPPPMMPGQYAPNTVKKAADGKEWMVKETRRGGSSYEWCPVGVPDWKPKRCGDDGVLYKFMLTASQEVVAVGAAEVLTRVRPWWTYDRVRASSEPPASGEAPPSPWDGTFARKDARKHLRDEESDEKRRAVALAKAKSLAARPLHEFFERGMRVEVTLFEDGLLGAWFSGEILQIKHYKHAGMRAQVRFDELLDDKPGREDTPLEEGSTSPRCGRCRRAR